MPRDHHTSGEVMTTVALLGRGVTDDTQADERGANLCDVVALRLG